MKKTIRGFGNSHIVEIEDGAQHLRGFVSFWKPGHFFIQKATHGRASGFVNYLKQDYRINTKLFLAVYPELVKAGIKVDITWGNLIPVAITSRARSKRQFQAVAVTRMQKSATGGLLWMATAAGKTKTAAEYCRTVAGGHLFIVDERTLLSQSAHEFENHLGEPVGRIGAGHFEIKRVCMATVQTLQSILRRRDDRFNLLFDFVDTLSSVIVDECHVMVNKRTEEILDEFNPPRVFGLSATMDLRKKHTRLPMYNLFGPVLYRYSLERGQQEGFLAQGRAIQIKRQLEVKAKKGEYTSAYRRAIIENTKRTLYVVDLCSELVKLKHQVVVLVGTSPELASTVAEVFRENGMRVAEVSGRIDKELRFQACQEYDAGKIDVLVANNVFSKGINIKTITMMIDCSAGASENMTVQKFGRGTRTTADKKAMIYFDIADMDGNGSFAKAAKSRLKGYKREKIPVSIVQAKKHSVQELALAGHKTWKQMNDALLAKSTG